MQWDANEIHVAQQHPAQGTVDETLLTKDNEKIKARNFFWRFLRECRDENDRFAYRERLTSSYEQRNYKLKVNLDHLTSYSDKLAERLWKKPNEMLNIFEKAALDAVFCNMDPSERPKRTNMKPIQIQLSNFRRDPIQIRNLGSDNINELVCVPGIIVGAGKVSSKATILTIRCRECTATKRIPTNPGIGGCQLPRKCDASSVNNDQRCPLDPFEIVADKCDFIDTQMIRLQEDPESVPTGEMPRGIQALCERKLVERVKPGARVSLIAVCCIREDRKEKTDRTIRTPYLRVVGIDVQDGDKKRAVVAPEEEERLRQIASDRDIQQKIADSIAPAIWGNKEIKKAVASLMFGGTRRCLPDGSRLRGDINVLLLGDPSCGKSQFLKFVHSIAPICVYTSGKGSSAAGLTAAVMRREDGFALEGGAMVLADGGIVCIDEFDKMREQDRVAIHEAMEQQTISIAKAGITTILNSRTSVLAAANPIFGRYDDTKTTSENIDFETTILSRFDLIFIIKDIKNRERDRRLASHIIGLHGRDASAEEIVGPIDLKDLGKLVAFARHNIHPKLTKAAEAMLSNHYVRFREEAKMAGKNNAIPITVRQLEAIIRISESLAKMELTEEATEDHVREAVRLFQVATMAAAKEGSGGAPAEDSQLGRNVRKIEKALQQRVAIGNKVSVSKLVTDLSSLGHSQAMVMKALSVMHSRGELEFQNRRKMVHRKK